MRRPRFTIRWAMTHILVIALTLAFFTAMEREGREAACGTPGLLASSAVILLGVVYGFVRLILFGLRHPS